MLPKRVFRGFVGATALAAAFGCCASEVVRIPIKKKGAGPLFQIHYGKKWGYINRNGKAAITPQFDDERDFFSGLAAVRQNRKWGYINERGEVAIPYQFDDAGDFQEGLAPVRLDRRWGFIDATGKPVIRPQFEAVAVFSGGLARFEAWDTISCDSLSPGQRATVYSKDDAPPLAFRLHDPAALGIAGCFPQGLRYGFVDKSGNVVIEPRLVDADDFSEGLAAVRTEDSQAKYGYIDQGGKMVIQPRFVQAYAFSEGLAAVEVPDGAESRGRWGFIGRTGRLEIPMQFGDAQSFSEGLAAVQFPDGLWGYVDKRGAVTIAPRYSRGNPFSEGLASVWPEDEIGGYYIDKTGRKALVIKLWPQWSFSDGLTVAGQPSEQKYVNRKGEVVAPYEVDPDF